MEQIDGAKYTVLQLREWLRSMNLPMSGNKAELVLRVNSVPVDERSVCPVDNNAGDSNADNDNVGDDNASGNNTDNVNTDEDNADFDDAYDKVESDNTDNNDANVIKRGKDREIELLKKELLLAEKEKRLLKIENELLVRENNLRVTPSLQGGSVPDVTTIKNFLPEYDGTGNIELWLSQIENLGKSFALQEDIIKALLMCNLKGNAKAWLHSKPNYMSTDISALFDEMRTTFKLPNSKLIQRRQFDNISMIKCRCQLVFSLTMPN